MLLVDAKRRPKSGHRRGQGRGSVPTRSDSCRQNPQAGSVPMLSPSTVTSPRGHPLLSTAGLYSMHNSFRVPRPGWMVGAQDTCNNLIVEGGSWDKAGVRIATGGRRAFLSLPSPKSQNPVRPAFLSLPLPSSCLASKPGIRRGPNHPQNPWDSLRILWLEKLFCFSSPQSHLNKAFVSLS